MLLPPLLQPPSPGPLLPDEVPRADMDDGLSLPLCEMGPGGSARRTQGYVAKRAGAQPGYVRAQAWV